MTWKQLLTTTSRFMHRQMLWLLIASYVLAGLSPAGGAKLRSITISGLTLFGGTAHITLPMLFLALLLFNAGLGIQLAMPWKSLGRLLVIGLVGSLVVPFGFITCLRLTAGGWHNPDELQNLLVGLALVAAMPIAGSSTAWSQNAEGDMALSVGLVLASTLLAPVTTPLVLHCVGFLTTGEFAKDLHTLARGGIGAFLTLFVLLPSLLGIAYRAVFGEIRIAAVKHCLRLVNVYSLLLLNYSNASVSLPIAFNQPDPDFLALILFVVVGLCICCFAAGWMISQLFASERPQLVAMTFGLGMANNGTGLVVASVALADHPMVMLPLIFYNLVQHLVAGGVDRLVCRPSLEPVTDPFRM
jgi:BASS family bile acid:Na+ symporter